MKLPSFEDAAKAIGMISGLGPTVSAATGLVSIVVSLFDDKPEDQAKLKAMVDEAVEKANASLDGLDAALDKAQGKN